MPASVSACGRAKDLSELGLRAVKRGVEAGDLRQVRRKFGERADRCQIVRLVQRRQRAQAFRDWR